MLFRNSPAFTSALISSRYSIIFTCTHSIYSSKIFKKGSFGKSISRRSKTSSKYYCFSVSTINSMNGDLCSVVVSERLKIRKSLAVNYWQDIISGVEVNSNDRNTVTFEEFQLVFNFMLFYHFNTNFFNSWKMQGGKNLGGFLRARIYLLKSDDYFTDD